MNNDIKDPNIEFASSSTFNPGLPIKNWFDKRSRVENASEDFIYHVYTKDGKKKRFILDRELAALVNTPTPEDILSAKNSGVTLISGPEFPHRELAANEYIEFDPFGQIFVKKHEINSNDELLRLVREIHRKIVGG